MIKTIAVLFLTMLCLSFLDVGIVQARDLTQVLRGPAFFPTDKTTSRPQKWLDAPIKYGKWAKGADVALTLDQHLYPIFLSVIQKYARRHRLNVVVREGTCGTTESMLNRKRADIGGFCCPPSESDRLPGLTFHTVGIAALAILVHPDNPVNNLTEVQVRGIFQGTYRRWSELPAMAGKKALNLPIRPVGRLHCKVRPGHWRLILDNEDQFSPRLTEVGTIPDMLSAVAGYKGTIGYEVLWNLERYKRRGLVKAIRVNGVAADDKKGVAAGRYPFYRTDNMSTWDAPNLVNVKAQKLVAHVMAHSDEVGSNYFLVPFQVLKKSGWQFRGEELVGGPE